MSSLTFLIAGFLLLSLSYLWIESYMVTPPRFLIYYALLSIALFAAIV